MLTHTATVPPHLGVQVFGRGTSPEIIQLDPPPRNLRGAPLLLTRSPTHPLARCYSPAHLADSCLGNHLLTRVALRVCAGLDLDEEELLMDDSGLDDDVDDDDEWEEAPGQGAGGRGGRGHRGGPRGKGSR